MKLPKIIALVPIATLLAISGGCEKEGPAEQAGENIDEAVETMQEKAEDTTDAAKEQMEQAGDKIEEATDQMTQ
jgi:uncharacterized protein YjbJ (UPF0337 family)